MTDTEKKEDSVLAKKAMIATLETSCWMGRKTDKDATEELLKEKKAENGAGNFSKQLIAKEALADIKAIISEARKYHKDVTLAWNENGGRLLPSTKYSAHTAKIRECQEKLEEAVEEFADQYANHVNESSHRLGDLFDNSEYPEKEDIKGKFAIDVKYDKVPEANDFRVDIPQEEQEKIREQVTEKVKMQHAEAMNRVWKRVYTAVENMHEKLKDEDKIFRNSMVEKIEDLVKILPELNITNNQELTELTEELKNELCGHNPDDLRQDKEARAEVASKSGNILDKINQISPMYQEAS